MCVNLKTCWVIESDLVSGGTNQCRVHISSRCGARSLGCKQGR